jgi:hypothetical protein
VVNAPYRAQADAPPRRKPHRRYLAYRALAVVSLVGWNALGFSLLWSQAGQPPVLLLAGVPLLLVGLALVFSWAAFPWPYSVFGPLERTPFPDEPATCTAVPMSTQIGLLRFGGPFVTFTVMPSGVGLCMTGGARVFVPAASITAVTASTLEHTCPEVRSPIRFRSRALHDAIAAMGRERGDGGGLVG